MTTRITENISVGSDTPILDEGHDSYESTSEVVDVIVESSTPLTVDVCAHETSDSAPELVESSVSSQIFWYSFATYLIKEEIDHETVDSSVVAWPSESPSY